MDHGIKKKKKDILSNQSLIASMNSGSHVDTCYQDHCYDCYYLVSVYITLFLATVGPLPI